MVNDMISLLNCTTRFDARYNLLRAAVSKDKPAARSLRAQLATAGGDEPTFALARRELGARGGFIPLMQHFPVREGYDRGYAIPWGARDYRLADWMEQNPGAWCRKGGGGDEAAGGRSESSSQSAMEVV